ncbi:peptidase T [Thioalkalivibrio denitrificans]|uniref:Isoaspartyl peptidase n=1 Tax=Thioalkalivibrio denitrificans TaxID=108003 RepID=A0A1V3NDZ9_9GAMM|nr:isoaspartyl peptidase/L-asparaginase family protein [Thioalkalivibrio denitrificans]OOG23290.1 peptidase T [Thioalkalivibrio denitrificans]
MREGPILLVHGGAGRYPEGQGEAALAGCEAAARRAWVLLRDGGTALDAVQAAVMALEDDPSFNAGTGSVLNSEGSVEMDASIMDGSTLTAGAVGAVGTVRNPVQLARMVLDEGHTVLRVGPAAETFARQQGLEAVSPEVHVTPRQKARWRQAHETVGCVALDRRGRLAAATSTGGLFDKPPGRVGDSSLIGCGTYADERGAVSCTGQGEVIIRAGLALRVLSALQADTGAEEAAQRVLRWLERRIGGEAGLILLSHRGERAVVHNAQGMAWCCIDAEGRLESGV